MYFSSTSRYLSYPLITNVGRRFRIGPKLKAIGVAVAYPKIPMSREGKINRVQSFACAIAAAVVGPPTLALDAKYNSLDGNLNMYFPIPTNVIKWTAICMMENKKRDGAFCNTNAMEPPNPETAKNICMNRMPIAVPVERSLRKKDGKIVADETVRIDMRGREDVPAGSIILVRTPPKKTSEEDIVKDVLMVERVTSLVLFSGADKFSASTGPSLYS